MTNFLSQRIQAIQPSATLAAAARANALKAQGRDIIDLSLGEPDFDTPEHIKEAATKALHHGATKYTATEGTRELRAAICQKFARDNDLHYTPEQIIVSAGAKQCIFNLAMALLNPGDEVIIGSPYWVSYPDIVLMADAKPVIITTTIAQQFKITPEQLAAAITPRTRLFIINSPSNPSGMTYTSSELTAIAKILIKHPQIVILTDDIYEKIKWSTEPFANLAMVAPELIDRTIVINGVSKTYAMTGWRIGYAAGPEKLINGMKKVQSQSTSNAAAVSQAAALAAIAGDQQCVKNMAEQFKQRHAIVCARLQKIPGIRCLPADGAFYSFADVSQAMQRLKNIKDDHAFCDYLLNQAEIAAVAGSAFGNPGHIRLSYAISVEKLHQALDRLEKAVTQ